jgi:hypothetical protein
MNSALSLHIVGLPLRYSGAVAGQLLISSLACLYVSDAHFAVSPDRRDLIAVSPDRRDSLILNAQLEGETLQLLATHAGGYSHFAHAAAEFWVSADGSFVELMRCVSAPEVWLFGPALILALARRGIYCLHASAFIEHGVATVILGESGAGKSSLARAIVGKPGARRLCDDITPVQMENGQLYVLPRFPQLKLKAADLELPESVPLKRLIVLQRATPNLPSANQVLTTRGLFDALTHHTVATRLFSDADMRAWWRQLGQMMTAIRQGHLVRPNFNAAAPEHAMLAALNALESTPVLCG